MANRWGIPREVEIIVLDRDKSCVYCGVEFNNLNQTRRTKKTWEHIINDIKLNSSDNIALCCGSCNASKGSKNLEDWLKSRYCISKNITCESVAPIIRKYLPDR